MKILENKKKTVTEAFSDLPEGLQVLVGSDITLDMDYYEADGTDRILWAIEGLVKKMVDRCDPERGCICINVTLGEKEEIDDEGNIL